MMEIREEMYHVTYDPDAAKVVCGGRLRLRGVEEYAPVLNILMNAADAGAPTLTLDLRELEFLNSSGISTLSRFALHLRNSKNTKLVIQASSAYPWQGKSLKNFERLLPGLEIGYS